MTDKHTPGPWRIGKNFGAIVADTRTDGPNGADDVEAYGGHLVCESVAIKNMRLIAAAPDLLAAVERLLRAHYSDGIAYSGDHPAAEARRAVAKAVSEVDLCLPNVQGNLETPDDH